MRCIQKQLDAWTNQYRSFGGIGNGSVVPDDILDIWKICSGNVDEWSTPAFKFDWKRTLGLYFWYDDGGCTSIADALDNYKKVFSTKNAAYPLPKHVESISRKDTSCDTDTKDICFLLLDLFCKKDTTFLDSCLQAESVSNNIVDYRITWILMITLSRATKIHPITDVMQKKFDKLSTLFVSQLESVGQWQLAIYVALFLSDAGEKEKLICHLIDAYYPFAFQPNSSAHSMASNPSIIFNSKETESFSLLTEKLCIPESWINNCLVQTLKRILLNNNMLFRCIEQETSRTLF